MRRGAALGAAVWMCACGSGPQVTAAGTVDLGTLAGPHELTGTQVDVAISRALRCGLDEGGRVSCWMGTPHPDFLGPRYVDLSGSDEQVCGVTATGLVQCSEDGGRYTHQSVLAELPQGSRIDAVSAGPIPDTWCALFDGRAQCDFQDYEGETQLAGVSRGSGASCAWRQDGSTVCIEEDTTTKYYGGSQGFPSSARIVDGVAWPNLCAVRTDGAAQCFGSKAPLSTPPLGSFARVWSAPAHACARTDEGALSCWGTDGPALTPPGGGWGEVSMWGTEACAVTPDERIQCWNL